MTRLCSLLICALLLAGCGPSKELEAARPLATTAIDQFHQQYNVADFAAIYRDGSPELRAKGPETKFAAFMNDLRQRNGKLLSGSEEGWQWSVSAQQTKIALIYHSKFENADAAEKFTFIVSGSSVALQEYHIDFNHKAGGE